MIRASRRLAAGVAVAAAGAVAACGSSPGLAASETPPGSGAGPATVSMATSIASGGVSWAVVPMSADPPFWEVFARAGNSGSWKLVTPPGVADNGGIVAAADGANSLAVAVRPSQDLVFSPLAETADGGASWSPGGPIDAAVAASPDAFAVDGAHLAAVLSDGTVEASSDAGATWSVIARPAALAASPAARGCGGAVRVTSVSFGITDAMLLAGGTCGTGGTAVFAYSPGGGWQRLSLPVPGRLVRLTGGMALVRGTSGLSALWRGVGWYAYAPLAGATQAGATGADTTQAGATGAGATGAAAAGWTESAPLAAPGAVVASGTLGPAGAWVLLAGGRAATVSALETAPGRPRWASLPPVPAHAAVLASGPGGAVDALAVAGETLTVWRLAASATAWSQVQRISVPVQLGSSG